MATGLAREIRSFSALCPAGTAKASPVTVNITMPARKVLEIEVRVPPGPRGEMGFSLGLSGTALFPTNAGGFIVTDDEVINWPVYDQPESGAWTVQMYNTGTYDHTIYLTFMLDVVQAGSGAPVVAPAGVLALPGTPLVAVP